MTNNDLPLEKIHRDFVANLSHELRTPLTVIRGYLEMLQDHKQLAPTTWHKMFDQMHEQSLRMEKLVEDLLLLSRLEIDLPEVKPPQDVAIIPLIRAVCDEAHMLSAGQHQIHFHPLSQALLYGQEDELRSAFSNLLLNAVKYTPANGVIDVTWTIDKDGAHFIVKDTGIGIAAHHLTRITQRFYRVDKARSRANGGTGLGLAIVKHVLLRHDAELLIQSELGKGSTFDCHFSNDRVTFPQGK